MCMCDFKNKNETGRFRTCFDGMTNVYRYCSSNACYQKAKSAAEKDQEKHGARIKKESFQALRNVKPDFFL